MATQEFVADSKESAIDLANILQARPGTTVEIIFRPPNSFVVRLTSADAGGPVQPPPPPKDQPTSPPPPVGDGQIELSWGRAVSADFRAKVISIAKSLSCDPNFLMAAMAFETGGSFSPSIQNPRSHATGLIQFMPTTAAHLGTSIDSLSAMTAVGQLDVVQQYLKPFAGRMSALSDVYMTILFPVAVAKPESFVLFQKGTIAYEENAGLDTNHDGQITKAEAASLVQKKLEEGMSVKLRG
jgi:hypothetical protein